MWTQISISVRNIVILLHYLRSPMLAQALLATCLEVRVGDHHKKVLAPLGGKSEVASITPWL